MVDNRPRLYSISEVAEYLNVTPRTVRRWIHAGAITAYRFGRQWRFEHGELVAFAERHRKARHIDGP